MKPLSSDAQHFVALLKYFGIVPEDAVFEELPKCRLRRVS